MVSLLIDECFTVIFRIPQTYNEYMTRLTQQFSN